MSLRYVVFIAALVAVLVGLQVLVAKLARKVRAGEKAVWRAVADKLGLELEVISEPHSLFKIAGELEGVLVEAEVLRLWTGGRHKYVTMYRGISSAIVGPEWMTPARKAFLSDIYDPRGAAAVRVHPGRVLAEFASITTVPELLEGRIRRMASVTARLAASASV